MAKAVVKKGKARPAADRPPEGAGTILSMEEAIQMLKTTRPSFYRWLRAGKFTGMKVGRQWRFYKEEVERFMKGETPRVEPLGAGPLIKQLEEKMSQLGIKVEPITGRPEWMVNAYPAADLLILMGVHLQASDIHIEPGQELFKLRFRVDGRFQPAIELDARWLQALINQFKLACGCNINERLRPQDGKIKFEYKGVQVALKCAFILAAAGESAVLSFMDTGAAASWTLDNVLAVPKPARERILRLLAAPYGMFLTVGPTGSGKTTSLYALLNHLNTPEFKVVSIESDLYALPGVLQLQVNIAAGNTFAHLLRCAFKTDPDILMLTEIPDAETMEIAIKAALTGVLVLSSLHTEDSAATLRRMVDFGMDPAYVGDATVGVLSQRLLRKVCPLCGVKEELSAADKEWARKVCTSGGLDFDSLPTEYRKQVGCAKCSFTGYKGRVIVVEVLEVTPEIRSGLKHGASVEQLRAVAIQQGMTTQGAEAVRAAAEGKTSIQEAMRISR